MNRFLAAVLWVLGALALVWLILVVGVMTRMGGMMRGGSMMSGSMMNGRPMMGMGTGMMVVVGLTWVIVVGLIGVLIYLIIAVLRADTNPRRDNASHRP